MSKAIEQAVRDYLDNSLDATVAIQRMPQGVAMPYAVVKQIDTFPGYHTGGGDRLKESQIHVLCVGDDYRQARELAKQIEDLFADGFQGELAGVEVRHLFNRGVSAQPNNTRPADERGKEQLVVELEILHR